MKEDISVIVDRAVESLRVRDARPFVEALRDLSGRDVAEVLADLCGYIVELADAWGDSELPSEDALGEPDLRVVVQAIRNKNRDELQSGLPGRTAGDAIVKLLAVAAALKKLRPKAPRT